MTAPISRDDVERLRQFHKYLVPISKFKEQRNIVKELNPNIELEPERLAITEDSNTPVIMVKHALEDLVKNHKKK